MLQDPRLYRDVGNVPSYNPLSLSRPSMQCIPYTGCDSQVGRKLGSHRMSDTSCASNSRPQRIDLNAATGVNASYGISRIQISKCRVDRNRYREDPQVRGNVVYLRGSGPRTETDETNQE